MSKKSKLHVQVEGCTYFGYLGRSRCQVKYSNTPTGRQSHAGTFNLTTEQWSFDTRAPRIPEPVQRFFENMSSKMISPST